MTDSEHNELEQLKQQVARLEEAVRFLAFGKQADERYAFFDWLVKNDVFDDTRTRLEVVLSILDHRLRGETPDRKRNIPGLPAPLLYKPEPPSYAETVQLLGLALSRPAHIIEELIDAFERQGTHDRLVALRRAARGTL